VKITVDTYAGYKGDERPICFRLGESVYTVERIIGQWYEPDGQHFRVRASDGKVYILRHRKTCSSSEWELG